MPKKPMPSFPSEVSEGEEALDVQSSELEADVQKAIADLAPTDPEDDAAKMIAEASSSPPVDPPPPVAPAPAALPVTRAEAIAMMDYARADVADAEAAVVRAKDRLDRLVGHHNTLPRE